MQPAAAPPPAAVAPAAPAASTAPLPPLQSAARTELLRASLTKRPLAEALAAALQQSPPKPR